MVETPPSLRWCPPPSLRWSHEHQRRLITDSCVSAGGTRDFQPWAIHQRFPTDGLELADGLVADCGDATEAKSKRADFQANPRRRFQTVTPQRPENQRSLISGDKNQRGWIYPPKAGGLAGLGGPAGVKAGEATTKLTEQRWKLWKFTAKKKSRKTWTSLKRSRRTKRTGELPRPPPPDPVAPRWGVQNPCSPPE